jgi:hypothetical protein
MGRAYIGKKNEDGFWVCEKKNLWVSDEFGNEFLNLHLTLFPNIKDYESSIKNLKGYALQCCVTKVHAYCC